MSLSSSQISGSRAAPRDPRDLSGRRPASVFHDRRQYKMAEESDDDEKMPPRKENALSGKGARGRTKAIHRSFAATPASARASARSQVDDIVSGGDESDDNFRERLNRELDGDRIGRLRDMNRQRLEALEQKLLDLHRQKHEIDGQSDEEARPSYLRHTKAYKPESYAESTEKRGDTGQTSDEGFTTDDAAEDQAGACASGTGRRVSGDVSEGGGGGGYTSDPGARKRSSAGMEGTGARVRISESTQDLRKLMASRPRTRKAPQTKPEPFSFQNRPPNPSMRKLKFEQEMLQRNEHEETELRKQFVMRRVPATTKMPLFEELKQKQAERSEEIRRKVCPLCRVSLPLCSDFYLSPCRCSLPFDRSLYTHPLSHTLTHTLSLIPPAPPSEQGRALRVRTALQVLDAGEGTGRHRTAETKNQDQHAQAGARQFWSARKKHEKTLENCVGCDQD